MSKTLLFDFVEQTKDLYLLLFLILLFPQKTAATTFYVNDNVTKGDIYTTAIGDDSNDGITIASPKLSIWSTYQKAQKGDTIIIDTGNYGELSTTGVLSFDNTKNINFIIAGISGDSFSKTPLPLNQKVSPSEFYIINDKPIDRDTYMQRMQNSVKKKSQ